MPEPGPTHTALAERNRLLSRTRTISLGIAGGAALATLGLGTAFAHAIPGHHHPPAIQGQPAQPGGGLPGTGPSASSSGPATSSGPARTARRRGHQARRHHSIAPPAQPPAPAPSSPAPPPVSSGGS
jgi:hypothetical protein